MKIEFPAGLQSFSGRVTIDGSPVGRFRAGISEGDLRLGSIEVSPTWFGHPTQGVGIGTAVIEELMREAQSRGARTFSSRITNPRILRILYKSRLLKQAMVKDDTGLGDPTPLPWEKFYATRGVESLPAEQSRVAWEIRGEMTPLTGERVGPEEVEAARQRVRAAMEALTEDRPLRWQVVGLSVAAQFPALRVLDDPSFAGIRVDPGGDGTGLLADDLKGKGATNVAHYGTEEELRLFKEVARTRGVSADAAAPGSLVFAVFLQQLLENLTQLNAAQMAALGVDLRELAVDLELLEKA